MEGGGEASYRYSALYRKEPGCNKVRMSNVFNDSCAYISRHTSLNSLAILGKHKDGMIVAVEEHQ